MPKTLCCSIACLLLFAEIGRADEPPKKIVLIAGPKSHGPVGNGIHDYPWSVKLLKVMLDNSNVRDRVRVEYHLEGWPADPATLDDADTIMVVSDGRDGERYEEAPHFQSPEKTALIEKQVRRGCGFLTFHFSTFAPNEHAERILDWSGGYFQWETDGRRQWYSAIRTVEADVRVASPEHPVARGLTPFRMREEFYYNLRFRAQDDSLVPIWTVPELPGREPDGRIVAWVREREEGGRGFGTTCGHFYDNWKHENFRRLVLNALVWTAGLDVPKGGVQACYYTHEEITAALAGVEGAARAVLDDRPIRALILTGDQHPAHPWRETTEALREALVRDPRLQVEVSEDVEDLATDRIARYDLLVLNYCNWKRPGLSEEDKRGFIKYLSEGGGLCIIHFANGAFHFSLPDAGDSDWPEYRRICRRVWDHTPGRSGHDRYGRFLVEITDRDHPITRGMEAFETTDELYYRQQGDEPIEVLATARSQVTGRHEPMAFVYCYGKGRVFQTVLGHGGESIRVPGTSELLRRGVAWVAGREQYRRSLLKPAAADKQSKATPLVEGRFNTALNAKAGGAFVAGRAEYRTPPLTVECRAKLDSKTTFNILVANELKTSATHWEMFSFAGTGHFTVYLPGMEPNHVRSGIDICDGRWHDLAMIYEPQRVRLYVDGKQVADQPIRSRGGQTVAGGLAIGSLVGREIGCDGAIDEVRITRGVREIDGVPHRPRASDERTLGLWRFDRPDDEGRFTDGSPLNNPARRQPSQAEAVAPKPAGDGASTTGHFGEGAVGFRWIERDSVDDRWNMAEIGPFLASIVPLPKQPPVRKGLSIRVGDQGKASVCYDTGRQSLRAAWTGGFLRFNPARFGLIHPPQIDGRLLFASAERAGWKQTVAGQESRVESQSPAGRGVRYEGLYRLDERVVLSWRVGETQVLESPWFESLDGRPVITRTLEVAPSELPLTMHVLEPGGTGRVETLDGLRVARVENGNSAAAVALVGPAELELAIVDGGGIALTVPPANEPRQFTLLVWSGRQDEIGRFVAAAKRYREADRRPDFQSVRQNADPRAMDREQTHGLQAPATEKDGLETRPAAVTTGVLGSENGPFAVDTLTLPFDNPHRALLFVGGHDFFSNGDLAVCTVHGDVWRVSGVDETLERLLWTRFATGLFQPLGLRIIEDTVYVLGRDQITRLHDRDGDGQADFYESFHNGYVTSPGGHDYVACLEADAEGNFYFVHATQGLLRVSADGRRSEVVATGFRNPNGLSVRPDGTVTVSPQEGEWTPASNIVQVRPGGYYGYGGPRVTPDRPLGYDPPLCWIPRLQDNSSGGQVWVPGDRWGPLRGHLLHLSYGKCRMLLVLRQKIGEVIQGGTVELPLDFDSGVMRGRFSPHDGHLYVSGLKGWVSAAVQDGCLQRVRRTGQPLDLPVSIRTMQNGLAVAFTRPLDTAAAEDPGNYHVQQWNYRYSAEYGSAEYRVSDPRQEGRDEVEVLSATLLDERTVFLEIRNLQPVMQLAVGYTLRAADGAPLKQTVHYTIHRIGAESMAPERLVRRERPGTLDPEQEAKLRPGLIVTFRHRTTDSPSVREASPEDGGTDIATGTDRDGLAIRPADGGHTDVRIARLAALHVPAASPPTPFLSPGPFTACFEGFLRLPLGGEYAFHFEGSGTAVLSINGRPVLHGLGDLRHTAPQRVRLHRGYNRLELHYQSPARSTDFPSVRPSPVDAKEPNATDGLAVRAAKTGEAILRLMWSSDAFADEPVPPTVLFHDGSDAELTAAGRLRTGRELFAVRNCHRCHALPETLVFDADGGMPELFSEPPDLIDAGGRLDRQWMFQWLVDPGSLRNQTLMPHLFDPRSPQDRRDAADLAAWLSSRRRTDFQSVRPSAPHAKELYKEADGLAIHPTDEHFDAAVVTRGRTLFEDLGCIACHRLTAPAEEDEFDRTSLYFVKAKYLPGVLEEFLRAPHRWHRGSRMPDFQLTETEAAALAAFLRTEARDRLDEADDLARADAARGPSLFRSRQCGQCHAVGEESPRESAPLTSVFGMNGPAGCLSANASSRGGAPRFDLDPMERDALIDFLATDGESLARGLLPEASRRSFRQLRCHACHPRDGQVSPRGMIIAEESERGLPPETLPDLTWAGEKLRPDWTARLLRGEIHDRPRVWLQARMPAFPNQAGILAGGLAAEHGLDGHEAAFTVRPDLVEAGRQLSLMHTGLDCRQCHGVGPDAPLGDEKTSIAPGINFAQVRERMRHDFYRRFLLDPPRYDINTKMPKLAADGRTTKVLHIYGGDAARQFEALWHYIQSMAPP